MNKLKISNNPFTMKSQNKINHKVIQVSVKSSLNELYLENIMYPIRMVQINYNFPL